jgi:hypothetical protein
VTFGLSPKIQLKPAGRWSSSRPLVVGSGEPIMFDEDGHYTVILPRIFAHEGKAVLVPQGNKDICLLKNPFFLANDFN